MPVMGGLRDIRLIRDEPGLTSYPSLPSLPGS